MLLQSSSAFCFYCSPLALLFLFCLHLICFVHLCLLPDSSLSLSSLASLPLVTLSVLRLSSTSTSHFVHFYVFICVSPLPQLNTLCTSSVFVLCLSFLLHFSFAFICYSMLLEQQNIIFTLERILTYIKLRLI